MPGHPGQLDVEEQDVGLHRGRNRECVLGGRGLRDDHDVGADDRFMNGTTDEGMVVHDHDGDGPGLDHARTATGMSVRRTPARRRRKHIVVPSPGRDRILRRPPIMRGPLAHGEQAERPRTDRAGVEATSVVGHAEGHPAIADHDSRTPMTVAEA